MCKVCSAPSQLFDTAQILGKYQIEYFRCSACGLIETEKPYWIPEAYAEAIAESDLGLVTRNITLARRTRVLLALFFRDGRRFVDYGGGYGMFVRLMRDSGFEFFRYDRYCNNLFARGFDVAPDDHDPFDLLTAFEVFEHLPDPVSELEKMLSMSPNIFFSTCLITKDNPPRPHQWWYYARETGQHVTLYTFESLRRLAESKKLFLHSVGDLHLFTKRPLPSWLFQLVFRLKVARVASLALQNKRSLQAEDYHRLTGQHIN